MRLLKLFLLFVAASLTACVQVPVNSDTKVSNLAVTSVWDIPTQFSQGTKYSISPQHLRKVKNRTGEIKNAYQQYANAIKANLNEHGFQEIQGSDIAELHIQFVLALSEDLDDSRIAEEFGITPGLQESQGLDKGSILIEITDAKTEQRIWHGVIQGFIQEDATEQERQQRRRYLLNMVLAQFYKFH